MKTNRVALGALACTALFGCAHHGQAENTTQPAPVTAQAAEADFKTVEGEGLEGKAYLTQEPNGVRVRVTVAHAAAAGRRGVHVHEKGDCTDIANKSMGAHFAPDGHDHALPDEGAPRHMGDLGNVMIDDQGNGALEILLPEANLTENDRLSLLGKALVIHEAEDKGSPAQGGDEKTGGSGAPVACAVIERN